MKNPTKAFMAAIAVALITCSVFSEQASAVPITGGVSLAGSYTTNTGDVNTATAFSSFTGVFVTSGAGSYLGTGGTGVTMNPFSFSPFAPAVPLWTFMFGGRTYSFDLTALTLVDHSVNNALTLTGNGMLHISGAGPTYDDTFGTWIFTANQGGGTFSFSSSNSTIPDGGSALALLGIGLVAVEAIRRKLAAV